ncbi:MAG: ATP-binding protein [Candidatus Hydrogenedentota bacterium]|nr:MAG: ATP-binding protein [Candidatus Hydrogenedentota bacterium]
MIGISYTVGNIGYKNILVRTEASIMPGSFYIHITGLGDLAVREARDRLRSAIHASGFSCPVKQILVNLAPNEIRKEGSISELSIAVSILIADGQLNPENFEGLLLTGALSLDGTLQSTEGILGAAIEARRNPNIRGIIVPAPDAEKVSFIPELDIYPIWHLEELHEFHPETARKEPKADFQAVTDIPAPDFASIEGHEEAKEALAIAFIGKHHTLMVGQPGMGKTLLARASEGLLPPLSLDECLELTQLASLAGLSEGFVNRAPFRSPHHTSSDTALVGGGSFPRPGEITLAHKGVLFLDELLEFSNQAIQALREPLEEAKITVSRSRKAITFPADFLLIAAANPCPCGNFLTPDVPCTCNHTRIERLYRKIAGPFLDRISIELEISSYGKRKPGSQKPTSYYRSKIQEARLRMFHRNGGIENSKIPLEQVKKWTQAEDKNKSLIEFLASETHLSHRRIAQALRTSLSIADYYESDVVKPEYIKQAFCYRVFHLIRQKLTERAA